MASTDLFRTPIAQNAVAAAAAGAGVYFRPARLPKWGRRALKLTNTAGTAGSLYLTTQSKPGEKGGELGFAPTRSKVATAASASSALAIATGGISLVSSGIGLKLDHKVEGYLVGRGVKHPRVWMAVGTVVVLFAVKQAQDYAGKRAEEAARKQLEKQQQGS